MSSSINFADLAKDCADALKFAIVFVDYLFEETVRRKALREAPIDALGPPLFRYAGAERTYVCAWCNNENDAATFQKCSFMPGLFIAVCKVCSTIIYPT